MEVQTERLDDGGMMEKRINVTSSDARTHLKCMFVNGLLSSTFVACWEYHDNKCFLLQRDI